MPIYPCLLVNCGHAAVENGAVHPLSAVFNIADAAGVKVKAGAHYGFDTIPTGELDQDTCDVVVELLEEAKIPFYFLARAGDCPPLSHRVYGGQGAHRQPIIREGRF